MPQKRLVSPDGRRIILASGRDEIERLEEAGYVVPSARRGRPEVANSGAEGHRRARASSTTEGQERNTGSTVEDPFEDDDEEGGDDTEATDEEPSADTAEKTAAARVAAKAAQRRPAKPTT